MRLLTGATGSIGGRLLRLLEEQGRAVRCLARPARVRATRSTTKLVRGDSQSLELIRALVERPPVMGSSRWVDTTTQPIAVRDVLPYLALAFDLLSIVPVRDGREPTHVRSDAMLKSFACGLFIAALTFIPSSSQAQSRDIVETAVAAGSFKTLAKALDAAGLVGTLKGAGPFTVFAPTDEAFAKLPAGMLADLLKPENKSKLERILKYHVISGKVMAADVVKLHSAKTVSGDTVTIAAGGGKVRVDNAHVVKTDIAASNGVIHVIDTVIVPKDH